MTKAIIVVMLAALSACSTVKPPPEATGPWHQLNPGKWAFNENDLNR